MRLIRLIMSLILVNFFLYTFSAEINDSDLNKKKAEDRIENIQNSNNKVQRNFIYYMIHTADTFDKALKHLGIISRLKNNKFNKLINDNSDFIVDILSKRFSISKDIARDKLNAEISEIAKIK